MALVGNKKNQSVFLNKQITVKSQEVEQASANDSSCCVSLRSANAL